MSNHVYNWSKLFDPLTINPRVAVRLEKYLFVTWFSNSLFALESKKILQPGVCPVSVCVRLCKSAHMHEIIFENVIYSN